MTPLTLLLTQAASTAPPIDWSRTVALAASLVGSAAVLWVVLGPLVDRLATWRTRAPESGMADAIRDALGSEGQAPETATWILDVLRKRPEETRGFVASQLREDLLALRAVEQTVRDLTMRTSDLAESMKAVHHTQKQHGDTLNILPALQHTFERFETAMERMQAAMESMNARLARMEGAAGWDGRERREHGR